MVTRSNVAGKRQGGTSRRYVVDGVEKSRRQYDKLVRERGLSGPQFTPDRLERQNAGQRRYNRELRQLAKALEQDDDYLKTKEGAINLNEVKKRIGKRARVNFVKDYNPETATQAEMDQQRQAIHDFYGSDHGRASIPKWVRPGETGDYKRNAVNVLRNHRNRQRRAQRARKKR